ncbi:hypothetical protein, partial [Methyloversatilis discipulorum]|uniref:hypothetical protein n=1 Tax=Methyloversatilis discipulorum TaxID=1119528 RepID=UPI003AF83F1F
VLGDAQLGHHLSDALQFRLLGDFDLGCPMGFFRLVVNRVWKRRASLPAVTASALLLVALHAG